MISLTEYTYVLGFWYVQGEGCDWLAAVTREPNEPFVMRYRFRYYVDDKDFDSGDVKSWWEARFPDLDEDKIIRSIDKSLAALQRGGFAIGEPWRAIVRGGSEAAMNALQTAPFVHLQTTETKSTETN
jgi:hypothetical protein